MEAREKAAVIWFSFLYVVIWVFSLANLFHIHFWDRRYVLSTIQESSSSTDGMDQEFCKIMATYYSKPRYIWFLPHILGAIFWWNLYFLQLIPQIRRNYKGFHRMLGRFLFVVLIVQNVTGFGLASTQGSNIIRLVSYILNAASLFCIYQAWRYAYYRDIAQHKYWVLRLVGYMQTIALQRFFLAILIISHAMGWDGLYPQLDESASDEEWKQLVRGMFDDSFVLCILAAILTTEWYLAAEEGKLEAPLDNRKKHGANISGNETSSLVAASPYGSI